MKQLSLLLTLCLLLTGCSGLPYPREMGDMALLRTMGVDREEEQILLTVSTGPRAKGLQGEQEPAMVLTARRTSLSAAALALQGLSDSYVFFGYVDQLLLGEEFARQGISKTLDYFARDVELGLGARLWIVRDATAQEAVSSGGEEGVDSRLSTLRTDGELGVAAISRTAGEVYSDILEQGSAYTPALITDPMGETALLEGGYAILKGERLVGFLEGEQARGLELLAGKPSADMLEVTLPTGVITLRVGESATACRLKDGGQSLSLLCQVTVHLVEYSHTLSQEERAMVEQVIQARETARITAVLDQLQIWGCDCMGLGPKAALYSPGQWSAVEEDWSQIFTQMTPEVTVQVAVHD